MTAMYRGRAASLFGASALLASAALLTAAPDAHASQGGCTNYSPGGYPIGICVNDRNTGTNAYPDYYVNSAVPANCRIQVEVWDNANHRYGPVFRDGSPCTRSHHPANGTWCVSNWDPVDYGSHVTVHAYFRLYSGSRQINDTSTNSPSITVSFTGMAHC